jgi:predicted amidophosphoribosyltransferase
LAGGLFAVFFPDQCRLCELPLAGFTRAPVCADCLESIAPADPSSACARCGQNVDSPAPPEGCRLCRPSPPPFDAAASFGVYDGDLRRLVHLLKYEKMLPLAHPLAEKMASRFAGFGAPDCIVPVPLYWTKRWTRGFNQSALLANSLAQRSGVPCLPRALRRIRRTAAGALKAAGASYVGALTLARAVRQSRLGAAS